MRRFLILACLLVASSALAADSGFYARTGTHPPGGDFFIPISARYIDDFGVGVGLGWQSRASGFMVSGQVTWDRIDGQHGAVLYDPYSLAKNRPMPVPYSTPSRSEVGLTVTFGIPIRSHK